jgi:hypothetical protein
MEISQTPCIAILSQKKKKVSFLLFSITKSENKKQNSSCEGEGYHWEGEEVGKGGRKVNMVQILCTHVCKWKNETCGNYSRNGGEEDKGQ